MNFSFTKAGAAEMLQRMTPGAQMVLQVVTVGKSTVTFRFAVVLDGTEIMAGDELMVLRADDTLWLPGALDIRMST